MLGKFNSWCSDSGKPKDISGRVVQLWRYSHGFFALLMFATFFASSQAAATAILALAGLSWAITLFAPFAIISSEISAQQALHNEIAISPNNSTCSERTNPAHRTGAIMGLHNVAISAPQILAALFCSVIYGMARALSIGNGTAWVLRAGGVAALGAAWRCRGFE